MYVPPLKKKKKKKKKGGGGGLRTSNLALLLVVLKRYLSSEGVNKVVLYLVVLPASLLQQLYSVFGDFSYGVCYAMKVTVRVAESDPDMELLTQQTVFALAATFWLKTLHTSCLLACQVNSRSFDIVFRCDVFSSFI